MMTATAASAPSEGARKLAMYRERPSVWVKHHLDVDLAKYRDRAFFDDWLAKQPPDAHTWARSQIAQDNLVFDSSRSYQAEALDLMATPGRYAIQWANGLAKTATAAMMILWFLDVYPNGKCVTTAGTWSQLREQLWREIPYWASRTTKPITANAVQIQKTQIEIENNWVAFGRAASGESTFEGVHAPYVLVVMDEAKAIPEGVFSAVRRIMRGSATGKYWFVCLSSPGSPSGSFWEITNGVQASRWTTLRLSAYESERVGLDSIQEDWEDLGDKSPLFISMVCGEFPDESDFTVIPLSWVQASVDKNLGPFNIGPRTLGVDVARFGSDETVLYEIDGRTAAEVEAYQGRNLMHTAGAIMNVHRRYSAIGIDDSGLGGGVTDRLREQEIEVAAINFGDVSNPNHAAYFDLGTEMWWTVRRQLELGFESAQAPEAMTEENAGLSIPDDKKLIHQLASRQYGFRSDGKIKLESKDDMRKRGERSPDRADALVIAHWVRGEYSVPAMGATDAYTDDVKKEREEKGLADWNAQAYAARRPNAVGRLR